MHLLPLLISLGLLAACTENVSTPDDESADNVNSSAGVVDDLTADNVREQENGNDLAANSAETLPPAELKTAKTEKPTTANTTVSALPLKRGFYVAGDTSCGQASNATLMLVGRKGINTSRVPCEFKKIEKIGANSYRVTESCTEGGPAWGTEEHISTNVTVYEITGDAAFTSKSEDGWENSAKYCPQPSLPEPWRNNDIANIIN